MTPDALCMWLEAQYPGTTWLPVTLTGEFHHVQETIRAQSTGAGVEVVTSVLDGRHVSICLIMRAGRQTFSICGYVGGLMAQLVHVPDHKLIPKAVTVFHAMLDRGQAVVASLGLTDELDLGPDA